MEHFQMLLAVFPANHYLLAAALLLASSLNGLGSQLPIEVCVGEWSLDVVSLKFLLILQSFLRVSSRFSILDNHLRRDQALGLNHSGILIGDTGRLAIVHLSWSFFYLALYEATAFSHCN
jgi:hypothetical protein